MTTAKKKRIHELFWQTSLILYGLVALLATASVGSAHPSDKSIKVFICAGQSNMVGCGDSMKLPDDLRSGNNRVLMFEDGKWQPFDRKQAKEHRLLLTIRRTQTTIQLIVDGDIVDLNRILLPPDTLHLP